ncbi:hypothetical protein WISP_33945 [Willisornis vidua]|uniref:Uncharacterized protein n=1 Tax=Willisornis vidua TaxID=1566151 RepID=A0ABQ9DNQ7_9PASS|nr:hypothetical protein WISP_33945 [Willisornis vidua]
MELCLGMGEDPNESLRFRITRRTGAGDVTVGVCYRPPEQEDQADETLYRQGLDVAEGEERGGFQPEAWGEETEKRTFNPADYTESSATDGFGTKSEIWETGQNDADDGTGAWKNSIEEWTAEDWNEDLSETKVFTASSVPAENHVTPGQSIDLVALLQKPVTSTQETEGNAFEAPQPQTFGQALVFTNSQHSTQMASGTGSSSAVNSYSPQSLSAVLCSGFGELRSSKLANSTSSQILDQLKSPGLGQFTSQNNSSATTSTAPASSWDLKPPISQSSVLSQFDFKSQPEPSPVLSQLTQRQQQQMQVVPVPPPGLESSSSQVKLREPSPVDTSTAVSKMLQLPTISMDNQAVTVHQTQQKQIKPPKRRITPASKVGMKWWLVLSKCENLKTRVSSTGVASGTRTVTVHLYWALGRPRFKSCVLLWAAHDKKDIEVLECVQRRARKLEKGQQHKSYKEQQRELGVFILEKKKLGGTLSLSTNT